jgi:hypothetical protein
MTSAALSQAACNAELKGGMIKILNLTDLQAVLFNDLLCVF